MPHDLLSSRSLGGGFKYFYSSLPRSLGRCSNLTNADSNGLVKNHQLIPINLRIPFGKIGGSLGNIREALGKPWGNNHQLRPSQAMAKPYIKPQAVSSHGPRIRIPEIAGVPYDQGL